MLLELVDVGFRVFVIHVQDPDEVGDGQHADELLVHPREVFAPALAVRAASVVLAHSHPSGNHEPSREDREATNRLCRAGKLLGIEVLDHLIFSLQGYLSFREQGLLVL